MLKKLFIATMGKPTKFGPFLHIKNLIENSHFVDNVLISELENGGIYVRLLNPEKEGDVIKMASLANGEETDATVFFTGTKPAKEETHDGLEGFPGWELKELKVKKVFQVEGGIVKVFDPELIKDSFPDVYNDLTNSAHNKM